MYPPYFYLHGCLEAGVPAMPYAGWIIASGLLLSAALVRHLTLRLVCASSKEL